MSITVPDRPHIASDQVDADLFGEDELLDAADEFEEALAADLLKRRVIESWW